MRLFHETTVSWPGCSCVEAAGLGVEASDPTRARRAVLVPVRVPVMRAPIGILTGLTLVVGFAVASLTGSRSLGGVVLVLGGAACAWCMWRTTGALRTVAALGAVVALFVVSHLLGHVIGAWPAVLLVAVVAGAIAYALASSPAPVPLD